MAPMSFLMDSLCRRRQARKATPLPPPARLHILVTTEMCRGTCGWWPREIDRNRSEGSYFARLTAGAYRAEVIELKTGGWMIARLDLAVRCNTLVEAIELFQRHVESEVAKFVTITTDPEVHS